MALSIRNTLAEQLAREVAAESGESLTLAIIHALEDRLERLQGCRTVDDTFVEIMGISQRCSRLPDLERLTDDVILGYGDVGYLE